MPDRNIPLFIAFRTLFNGRFYYPVFSILFLDYGLTFEQFAILNAVWAATSIILEVPSGAMADVLGRKRMLVLAAFCMVAEMALIAFVPLGNSHLVFTAFLINRVLSGCAESFASGADEALAYDSLPAGEGRESAWATVLERTMRWQSAFFIVASLLGAAVYDHRFLASLGLPIPQEVAIRLPIYLTLGTALLTVVITLSMRELRTSRERSERPAMAALWKAAFAQTLGAGRWILSTRAVMAVLLAGVFLDSVIRLFLTVNSQYYRLIGLPEASFGLVGTAMAVLGIFTPTLAKTLQLRLPTGANFLLTGAATLLALGGAALALRSWGVLFAALIMIAMTCTQYFMSNGLNRLARPEQRATVLSFRGLLINFAYGTSTLAFGAIMNVLQKRVPAQDGLAGSELSKHVENQALWSFLKIYPIYVLVAGSIVALGYFFLSRGSKLTRPTPPSEQAT
jgi:MFS family permease